MLGVLCCVGFLRFCVWWKFWSWSVWCSFGRVGFDVIFSSFSWCCFRIFWRFWSGVCWWGSRVFFIWVVCGWWWIMVSMSSCVCWLWIWGILVLMLVWSDWWFWGYVGIFCVCFDVLGRCCDWLICIGSLVRLIYCWCWFWWVFWVVFWFCWCWFFWRLLCLLLCGICVFLICELFWLFCWRCFYGCRCSCVFCVVCWDVCWLLGVCVVVFCWRVWCWVVVCLCRDRCVVCVWWFWWWVLVVWGRLLVCCCRLILLVYLRCWWFWGSFWDLCGFLVCWCDVLLSSWDRLDCMCRVVLVWVCRGSDDCFLVCDVFGFWVDWLWGVLVFLWWFLSFVCVGDWIL